MKRMTDEEREFAKQYIIGDDEQRKIFARPRKNKHLNISPLAYKLLSMHKAVFGGSLGDIVEEIAIAHIGPKLERKTGIPWAKMLLQKGETEDE